VIRAALAAAALAASTAYADTDLQRHLESLKLGDDLSTVEQVYPPKKKWSSYTEPGGRTKKVMIKKGQAKYFPLDVDSIDLRLRRGRVVSIKIVYDKKYTRKKPLSEIVKDLSLIYGEPRRYEHTYFWDDGSTVLAAKDARLPTGEEGRYEFRTSLELLERRYFAPLR